MKIAAIALVAASLMTAGAAAAADHLSDINYLRASRCSGLAAGLQAPDAASLATFVRQEGRQRDSLIAARSQSEFDRAKRQVRVGDKARAESEYASACTPFVASGQSMAAGAPGSIATR